MIVPAAAFGRRVPAPTSEVSLLAPLGQRRACQKGPPTSPAAASAHGAATLFLRFVDEQACRTWIDPADNELCFAFLYTNFDILINRC